MRRRLSHTEINICICIGLLLFITSNNEPLYSQEYIQAPYTATKMTYTENNRALKLGFWVNYNKHDVVFERMGKRPIGRVDFKSWAAHETSKGTYDFGKFKNYKRSHIFGEDPIGCINISFTEQVGPKTTIPDFYYPRITDPETRQAAKDFLYAYIQELVKQCGEMMLAIDYEIYYNYGLFKSDNDVVALADEWGEWYVEAAAVVRKACDDMGHPGAIKLIPIINGQPFKSDLFARGTEANQWLHNVVAASDYLGMDCYHWVEEVEVSNPTFILKTIRFWLNNYAADKDLVICENGFTSVTTEYPDIYAGSKKGKLKYGGTEAEQELFFRRILDSLQVYNQPGGIFDGQVSGYNIWCITDNHRENKNEWETYFGLIREDMSEKPAFDDVRNAYISVDHDPVLQPSKESSVEDITATLPEQSTQLYYNSGTENQSVKCSIEDAPAGVYRLSVNVKNKGGALLTINDSVWLYRDEPAKSFDFDLRELIVPGENNTIELFLTGEKYPFVQEINNFNLEYYPVSGISDPKNEASNLIVWPNPANEWITIEHNGIGQNTYCIMNSSGIEVKKVASQKNKTRIHVADLPVGLYFIKVESEINDNYRTGKFIVQ